MSSTALSPPEPNCGASEHEQLAVVGDAAIGDALDLRRAGDGLPSVVDRLLVGGRQLAACADADERGGRHRRRERREERRGLDARRIAGRNELLLVFATSDNAGRKLIASTGAASHTIR